MIEEGNTVLKVSDSGDGHYRVEIAWTSKKALAITLGSALTGALKAMIDHGESKDSAVEVLVSSAYAALRCAGCYDALQESFRQVRKAYAAEKKEESEVVK